MPQNEASSGALQEWADHFVINYQEAGPGNTTDSRGRSCVGFSVQNHLSLHDAPEDVLQVKSTCLVYGGKRVPDRHSIWVTYFPEVHLQAKISAQVDGQVKTWNFSRRARSANLGELLKRMPIPPELFKSFKKADEFYTGRLRKGFQMIKQQMSDSASKPVLENAPLLDLSTMIDPLLEETIPENTPMRETFQQEQEVTVPEALTAPVRSELHYRYSRDFEELIEDYEAPPEEW